MVGIIEDKELFSETAKVVFDAREDNEAREEWHKQRSTTIGGSEIGNILGLSKYGSALTVYQDKLGISEPFLGNIHTIYGNRMEPIIRDWVQDDFEATTKIELNTFEYPYMMHSKEHNYISANIDGLGILGTDYKFYENNETGEIMSIPAGQLFGLEIKTASEFLTKMWEGEEIPSNYYCQVQWYMYVTGLKHFMVIYLIGKEIKWKVVPRCDADIQVMKNTAIDFWDNNVLLKVPPLPVGVEAETKAILYQQTLENSTEQEISDNKLTKYQEVSDEIKELGKEKERLKQLIYLDLENSKKGTDGNYKVSRFEVKKDKIDTKLLKSKYSDIYKAVYNGQSEFVSMKITKCK